MKQQLSRPRILKIETRVHRVEVALNISMVARERDLDPAPGVIGVSFVCWHAVEVQRAGQHQYKCIKHQRIELLVATGL